jgi:hypothetical protein
VVALALVGGATSAGFAVAVAPAGAQSDVVSLTPGCVADDGSWTATLVVTNTVGTGESLTIESIATDPAGVAFAPLEPGATVADGASSTGTAIGLGPDQAAILVEVTVSWPASGGLAETVGAVQPAPCAAGGPTTTAVPATIGPTTTAVPATVDTSVPATATSTPPTTAGPQPTVTAPPSTDDPGQTVNTSGPPPTAATRRGEVTYQPEREMTVGQQYLVEAAVVLDDVGGGATPTFRDPSPTTVEVVRVPCSITARLDFDERDFLVIPPGPSNKDLCDGPEPDVWVWTVTPLRPGVHRLLLNLVSTAGFAPVLYGTTVGEITVLAEDDATASRAGTSPPELPGRGADSGGNGGSSPIPLIAGSLAAVAVAGGAGAVVAGRRRNADRTGHRGRRPSGAAAIPTVAAPTPDAPQVHDVFLSYSRRDAEVAQRLVSDLEARGFDVWRDTDDIRGGEVWRASIADALDRTAAVVLLVSPNSAVSKNVSREISLADGSHTPVIPVLVAPTAELEGSLRYTLADTQMIDLTPHQYTSGFDQLIGVLAAARDQRRRAGAGEASTD